MRNQCPKSRPMKRIFITVVALASFTTSCIAANLPSDSIYRLDALLTIQDGREVRLASFAGQVQIITMFYTSCPYVCPKTIETLKRIDAGLSKDERARLHVLLVSVDPERDNPEVLASLAEKRGLDLSRWSLARAQAGDVRKIAALLGVQYRQLRDKEFNHSTILTLVSPDGRIIAKSSSTATSDAQFVAAVRNALSGK